MTARTTSRALAPLVRGRELTIGYRLGHGRQLRLLVKADFELVPGELVCLLGPNGSGKSTLLRTLVGMQRPIAGHVEILGRDLREVTPAWLARHVSVVLTEPIDAGALTARELVGLGRYPYTDWLGRLTAADHERVRLALGAVDALPLADRQARNLSDGERQRVLVARALAQEPQLMVLDEPTAYLDLPRRIEMIGLLRRLVRETGVTVFLSTHQLDLALSHADRVLLLPPGGPLEIGAPEDVALSGGLERTFASDRLVFDPVEGTFRLREEGREAAPTSSKPEGEERSRRSMGSIAGATPEDGAHGRAGALEARLTVALDGDGLTRRWTERALRRAGFAPVALPLGGLHARAEATPFARVRVVDCGGATPPRRFEVEVGGDNVVCTSLHALLAQLEAHARRRDDAPHD